MAETEAVGTTRAGEAAGGQANAEAGGDAGQKIDLQALAERIYRLLKEEARVERERLGRFQEGIFK